MTTSHKATATTCWPDGVLVFHCFGYFASDHLMQTCKSVVSFFSVRTMKLRVHDCIKRAFSDNMEILIIHNLEIGVPVV